MRPRNVLKLFSYSRSFANNFSKPAIDVDDIQKGLNAYSQDLIIDFGHELVDVNPGLEDLIYYLMDASGVLSRDELNAILSKAGVDDAELDVAIDFLLYYGAIGLSVDGQDQYIFNVHYDSKVLQIRAELAGDKIRYVVNPAFTPALTVH